MRRHTGQSSTGSKSALRRELRSMRGKLPSESRTLFDRAIRQHLLRLVKSRNAQSIACYWPFNGEPDIMPLCRQWQTQGHQLALPVVSGKTDHLMTFHRWREGTTLVKNKYGICEPHEPAAIPISDFDILIIPLVGYDRSGNRIGMGAGYYDRHLEMLRDLSTPLRVGIAYSLQEIGLIEKNNWDIPLHGIVNEHGWFTFVG